MLKDDIIKALEQSQCPFNLVSNIFDNPEIQALTLDSRQVQKGALFVGLKGTHLNGEEFILDAIQKDAWGIATSLEAAKKHAPDHPNIFFLASEDVRLLTSHLSKLFYPHQPDPVVAVTGTNGKTSTVEFVRQLWEKLGKRGASLGTLGMHSQSYVLEKHLTTPEAPYLHEALQTLYDKGITHLAMEASSHGIDQRRMENVELKAAGFTNLSPEHLDYHGTMQNYLEAKAQLFQRILPEDGTAVLNADIPEFQKLKTACGARKILSYGRHGEDIQVKSIKPTNQGQSLELRVFNTPFQILFPLIGEFQVYNALCALGLVLAEEDVDVTQATNALTNLNSIPGRLEHIAQTHEGASIYIDYAHTPDGIQNLLSSLRKHTTNKVHIVFGGGGDRDESTRQSRGEIAQRLADSIYICDDNPRFEDPQKIRSQILKGCPKAREIPDRTHAIQQAIQSLEKGDTLVVAGKGREQGQTIQGHTAPFDDTQTILTTLETLQ